VTADDDALASAWPEIVRKIQARTPARLLVGRSGGSYRTSTQLQLRADHAAAVDSVRTELDLERDLGKELIGQYGLFEVSTRATSKTEYLMRPDLGRSFSDASRSEILQRCEKGVDFQIVIGDGLSVTAVSAQVPALLPLLRDGAVSRGWKVGQTFAIRHCRVGVLNEVGELLHPKVVVLLIGERPGLSTAESLSAYLAFQPRQGHTDADRNLISNIHRRGVPPDEAAVRILNLAALMMSLQRSGAPVKEQFPPWEATPRIPAT
jgi:ethanolamine ammonia-lyase small subunit